MAYLGIMKIKMLEVVTILSFINFLTSEAYVPILKWNETDCRTSDSQKCVFPMYYKPNNVTYYGCQEDRGLPPWCVYDQQQNDYFRGVCNDQCPLASLRLRIDVGDIESGGVYVRCSAEGSPNPTIILRGIKEQNVMKILARQSPESDGPPKTTTLNFVVATGFSYKCTAFNTLQSIDSKEVHIAAKCGPKDSPVKLTTTDSHAILYTLLAVISLLVLANVVLIVKLKQSQRQSQRLAVMYTNSTRYPIAQDLEAKSTRTEDHSEAQNVYITEPYPTGTKYEEDDYADPTYDVEPLTDNDKEELTK